MRKHTQKKVTVSYWSQQNGLLRVTLPATVPPGQSPFYLATKKIEG